MIELDTEYPKNLWRAFTVADLMPNARALGLSSSLKKADVVLGIDEKVASRLALRV